MSEQDPLSALGGLEGLLRQAQEIQQQLADAQDEAAGQVVEGHAGGGVVRIVVGGDMEFHSVHIDRGAVDPADVEMLEDLVLAALHDAVSKVRHLNEQAMGVLGGLASGMGLGGLPGRPPGLPGLAAGPEPAGGDEPE